MLERGKPEDTPFTSLAPWHRSLLTGKRHSARQCPFHAEKEVHGAWGTRPWAGPARTWGWSLREGGPVQRLRGSPSAPGSGRLGVGPTQEHFALLPTHDVLGPRNKDNCPSPQYLMPLDRSRGTTSLQLLPNPMVSPAMSQIIHGRGQVAVPVGRQEPCQHGTQPRPRET